MKHTELSRLALGTKKFVSKIKVNKKIYTNNTSDKFSNILQYAVENGINLVEIATFYPSSDLQTMSKIIQEFKKLLRFNLRIGYKIGNDGELVKENGNLKPFLLKKDIIKEVENSLRLFSVDCIDILTICGIKSNLTYLSDVLEAFYWLNTKGYVKWNGIFLSEKALATNLDIQKNFQVFQFTYNIINQEFGEHIKLLSEKGKVLTCAPLANGVLSRKYTDKNYFMESDIRTLFYTKEELAKYNQLFKEFSFLEILEEKTKPFKGTRSFVQGALKFVLQNNNITSTICGVSSIKQLSENLYTFNCENLSELEINLIETLVATRLKE
jgi:aryl-alcohol dehydrogenase-like predicted oxidoreductase